LFNKTLTANRGEIAVRILRACRELGIETVAVYSDADRRALHVRQAGEAYHIGPALARKSYLRGDHIIDAAKRSGAQAIHPGYGFLAENPEFAAACADACITFVGPPASAIAAMGDKVAARRLMQEAGVPIVPGTETGLLDGEMLVRAGQIGFPLFVKTAAGGGGKGMRLVHRPDELEGALASVRREANKAFGDDRVYLEKAIQGARHVEIQALADAHGNLIYLGERECSIQRRHQKLVEEAPSPVVDEDLRQRMGQVAIQAALAVNYVNAGTLEFLLDAERNFYFLEMNTRLQVEHPVTESVTGVDIVKEQFRLAAGEPLGHRQDDILVKGWAIECRITAEDPLNGFLPTSGRVIRLFRPSGPGVRVDSCIYEGLEVSLYYDPLMSKLIAWGNTREEAIQRIRGALEKYRIVGVPTSIPFHLWVMGNEAFLRGNYSTSFLQDELSLTTPIQREHGHLVAIVATLLSHQQLQRRRLTPLPCDQADQGSDWLAARRIGRGRSPGAGRPKTDEIRGHR
jgi:acetyl-CoA carboxylase biotin carboxylase subunit